MPVLVPAPYPGRRSLRSDSLDKGQPLVWSVEDFWSAARCAETIARIEALGLRAAPVISGGREAMSPEIRNNTRVLIDDQPLADELDALVRPHVPAEMFGEMAPAPICVNERFRAYRYEPGQRFAPHFDGSFQRDRKEESLLTFMVYLNDGFGGGSTRFEDYDVEVRPKTGTALFFQHRLLHEGAKVQSGVKYVLRSDVMYRER